MDIQDQGNSSVDPSLITADFRIPSSTSSAVDTGNLADSPIVDFENEPRPDQLAGNVDKGWDEFVDSDSDGLPDWFENGGELNVGQDFDNDDVDDEVEYTNLTNPYEADTDGDGLDDGDEITFGTDSLDPDSDQDGMPDGWEVEHGLKPLEKDNILDPDEDGYANVYEFFYDTDPDSASSAPSPTIFVSAGADGNDVHSGSHILEPKKTLQAAVDTASDFDIIGVLPGVYKGIGNQDLLIDGKSVALIGLGEVVLQGEEGAGRGITIVNNSTLNHSVLLRALIIRDCGNPFDNNYLQGGGVCLLLMWTFLLSESSFIENVAIIWGGGSKSESWP